MLFYRFQKIDFLRLVDGLQIPDYYVCKQRTVCPGQEALLILLRRLTYPNRWCDLIHMFGRQEPELSMIFNEVSKLYNIVSTAYILNNFSKTSSLKRLFVP